MKNWKKIVLAATSTVLACGIAVACASCGVSGDDYTFEAENAVLSTAPQVETGFVWDGDKASTSTEATMVGYFTAANETITFNIKAEAACKVEITLYASSTNSNMRAFFGDEAPEKFIIDAIDLSKDEAVKLSVNGTDAKLKGTLPGLTLDPPEGDMGLFGWMMDGTWGALMKNIGTGKVVVDLKEGDNTIVLTAQGMNGGQGGINVDKIVVKSPSKLTWTPTDNSDRVGQQG